MGEDTIVLSAENCSFTVPRSILAEHSVYFAAALESEMLEFATGRFVFPDFTASQLSLFVQCAQSGFTHWPENECESSTVSDRVQCDVFLSNLSEVLELDCVADYLQISSLTDMCAARLSKLLAHVFDSYATSCEKHQSPVFEKFLYLWATFEKRLTRKLNDILFRFTARNPVSVLTSFPSPPDASLGATVIELIVSVLTSDTLCVSDEDQVLEIALNWIRLLTPSGDRSSELVIVRSFLNCVRLGLLSPSGRSDMAQFWSIFYPEFKWQDQLTYDEFVSVLRSNVCKVNHASGAAIQPCCCPRASTPCLLSILPNCNGAGLELWAFNLLTGEHRAFSLTEHLLCYLSHDFPPAYDDDIHIYLCHSSVAVPDSSVVFLIYHPYQHGGSLIGFVWCLSTGKVQWIPRLPIHPDDRTTPGVPHSARTSSSRRFDLVTLRTGLLVYFLAPVHSWVLIFAFTFDFASWTWHTLPPTTVIWYPVGASVRSTPIKQLSSITHDGWVYAHVEIDEQSIARALPISRHNLHQLSLHRSVLCRFRPLAYTEQETCRFELEILPPAPFLVRIYRLLVLNAADRQYLFAFGTCGRDEQATQFCLDVEGRRWIRWSTWNQSTDQGTTHDPSTVDTHKPELVTNLSPELLGFRGIVCSAQLPTGWIDNLVRPSDVHAFSLFSRTPEACGGNSPDLKRSNTNSSDPITPTLVLIGRPNYHSSGNRRTNLGIWFHKPTIVTNSQSSIPTFKPREPAIPLPTYLTRKLYEPSCSSVVIYVNWDNVIQSSELFRFTTPLPDNGAVVEECYRPPRFGSSSNFGCLRYPWNWSSQDSD